MKLSLTTPQATQSVLIYGPPKSGKTQIVGELSSHYNLIWFDLEHGSDTLRKLPLLQQERIELISLADTRSYPIAVETCLKVIKGGPVDICETHGKVGCQTCAKTPAESQFVHVELNKLPLDTIVVFDSLTQLTNSGIAHITKNQPEDYRLEYNDWANLGKIMETFLSHLQQAKFNVVCISHEVEAEMEDGKMKIFPVSGTRNFSRNTAKYFGHVVYANIKLNKHVFASSSTAVMNTMTGSRLDVATEKMEKPSLLSIFQNGAASAKKGPQPQTNGQIAAGKLAGLVSKQQENK